MTEASSPAMSLSDWFTFARAVCAALHAAKIPAAVTGSFACFAYGCARIPRDIDVEIPAAAVPDIAARRVGFYLPARMRQPLPRMSIAGVPEPADPSTWELVEGVPFVPPWRLVRSKVARAAASAQGIATGCGDPGTDIPDALDLLRLRPIAPLRPRSLERVLRAAVEGRDVGAALRAVPPGDLLRIHAADPAKVDGPHNPAPRVVVVSIAPPSAPPVVT